MLLPLLDRVVKKKNTFFVIYTPFSKQKQFKSKRLFMKKLFWWLKIVSQSHGSTKETLCLQAKRAKMSDLA